jgi:Flp pilus assembly protein TadG
MVEFAIAFGLLLTIFTGVWQFGYAFYVYNQLESTVRNAARYASVINYDGGSWGGATFNTKVKNMAVYGKPDFTTGDKPIAPGLTTANARVTITLNGAVPSRIAVDIVDYNIETFFKKYSLSGKPRATFEYMGRYIVPI